MRNSVVVIFGLAAVLFVADSDSAAARSVSERARRAADGASELAAASYGEEASPTAEESSPEKRLHKRSSYYYRQSQPEIDVSGLATALRQLEIQLTQITNQVAASLIAYDPMQPLSPKRSNTPANSNAQAEKIAAMAYETVLALAKQLQSLQGSLVIPDEMSLPEVVVEGKPAQVRQAGPVPLPMPVPGEPGYQLPEITLPLPPVTLPYNPALLPYNPASLPYNPPHLPYDPAHLPYDPENTQAAKPKPLPATKPKPEGPRPIGDSSGKPYPADETSDSSEDDTDQNDNGQETTKIVYESRMDDNPYNLIPAVLHLRMKKQ